MTVKEFKQHANTKVQVLIPSDDVYDVYHSRTQECYLYAGDAATCDDKVIDFFEIDEYEANTIYVYTK